MNKIRAAVLAVVLAGLAVGCGSGSPFSTNPTVGNPVFTSSGAVMQLAMGTINDSAGTFSFETTGTATPGTDLNAVATFRNSSGLSAFINPGTATLTGPSAFSSTIGSVFSYGQAPGTNSVVGKPPAYTPANTAPGYATGFLVDGTSFAPFGAPVSGAYTIATSVSQNGTVTPYNATATLPAIFTVLGPYPAPTACVVNLDGSGSCTVAPPVGVTETLVVVTDSTGFAELATSETTTTTASFPAGTFTGRTPPSFAYAIGADYPLVEAGPPKTTTATPTITGSGGTADLTFSGFSVAF